jgi:hypothetical protein
VLCAFITFGLSLGGLSLGVSNAMAGSISDLTPHEAQLFNLTNQARAANGLVQLRVAAGATDVARNWTRYMATSGSFRHNPNYVAELRAYGQSNATAFSENIAYGHPTADALFNGYMASPTHRANILAPAMRFVGIGSVRDAAGRVYNTMNFVNAEDGSRPRALSAGDYFGGVPDIFLSTAASGSLVGSQFDAPWATGTPVVCDWNGDGVDSVAFFNQGWWSIPESNSPGARVSTFGYGNPTDQPLCGDWNRDGIDTIGVYRNGWAFLRDANSTGNASVSFAFGNPGDVAVAGDFNGDGWDSVGVRRGNTFYLSNSHFRPVAEITVTYGLASDRPLMADINGDGVDTIAVHRNNTFFFSSSNTKPDALIIASFGNPTDVPLVGNFSGDRRDEKGLYRR